MIEIRIRSQADWEEFQEKLDNLDELGNEIGVTMKAESEKAFEDQEFGGKLWPYRYQDSAWDVEPFVNVAGAVADLSRGPNVSENNFVRRPALKHTGTLRDSLTFAVHKSRERGVEVEVGTNSPYAEVSQLGGPTTQPLTDSFKQNLNKFLEKKNVRKKQRLKKGALGPREKDVPGSEYKQLEKLLTMDELTTEHWARPFVGFTHQSRTDVEKLIGEFFLE